MWNGEYFFFNESWNSTPVYLIEIYYQDYMTFLIVNLRNNIKKVMVNNFTNINKTEQPSTTMNSKRPRRFYVIWTPWIISTN